MFGAELKSTLGGELFDLAMSCPSVCWTGISGPVEIWGGSLNRTAGRELVMFKCTDGVKLFDFAVSE